MIRGKVKVLSAGLMDDNTLENGRQANNMGKVLTLALTARENQASGKMERKSNGSRTRMVNDQNPLLDY